ncbi:MAG: amidohydrolase family protein [Clostridiaceae bacterium]
MLKIKNGRVYDPKNGINGEVKDIYYENGRIAQPTEPATETFDASGCVVMAGGIDVHSHIAGEPLALLRDAKSPAVPTTNRVGSEYAHMGYTLAVNAAMPALAARHTISEENAIPALDMANLVWVGENPVLLELAERGSDEELDQYLSWLLAVSGGWGLKLINPREGQADGELPYRKLIDRLIEANARLKLPHSLHLHHPFLGRPDAYEPIAETIKQTEGRPLHFAHLQFYGYSRTDDGKMSSAAEQLANLVNANKNITCDVGAVTFGPAAAVTADANFAKKLGRGKRGFQSQWWELDGAFGVLPLKYEADKIAGAVQFLTGLELMLMVEDASRIFLTTDHPNGGPFTDYPFLIRLLMDKSFRDEQIQKLNPKAVSQSAVPSISREYSLYEIAEITRSGPAAVLGLQNRGHLGAGAEGGVAVYREQANKQTMFREPAAVFRGETAVLIPKERAFDEDWVERRTISLRSGNAFTARLEDDFLRSHRVARQEV